MHDIADLDTRGVPGGFVASAEFKEAAEAQAASLGFDAPVVYVRHPIQDRTDEEMKAIAKDALDSVARMVSNS